MPKLRLTEGLGLFLAIALCAPVLVAQDASSLGSAAAGVAASPDPDAAVRGSEDSRAEAGAAPNAQSPAVSEPSALAEPVPTSSSAGLDSAAASEADWSSFSASSQESEQTALFDTRVYGYINTYFEQVGKTPDQVGASGRTEWKANPYQWDVLNAHVMVQGSILKKYHYYLNLAAYSGGHLEIDVPLTVRNAWVELPIYQDNVLLRVGKTYRRFGLYNEILDAIPTYVGVHPPEIFDDAHLMLTRTTNLMLHGRLGLGGERLLQWSLFSGTDERRGSAVPLGADVSVGLGQLLRVGASGYWTGGQAEPYRDGEEPPRGGVVYWMQRDRFHAYALYTQLSVGHFQAQVEYARAIHHAQRDPEIVMGFAGQPLSPQQLDRYFVGGDPAAGLRALGVDYSVHNFYTRLWYEFELGAAATLTPYLFFDYYSNPETIRGPEYGGGEVGLSDTGSFIKFTAGAVLRPISQVALKLDGALVRHLFNNEQVMYGIVRASFSYLWELPQ